ncbi:putative cyclin-dependent serine/threonine-protein kinase DDB_G0272797/DDB_G0274007 [Polistes fuscatus]|uniref:putative cyclin-dependent serine/threonine-protein kinase DDB_G0272797/DDB_G0274007 n=1 Tax=Polistes fuscatus TaxID=30207 RepID=UPI001CA8FF6E|nr:putative cyclin-dependent serine/threonine-protein kinase DDB_G0272797/DDB_G0274007 [Polistes fuscatus]
MILLSVFILTLVSTVLAQTDNSTRSVRAPQGAQLNYDDPSGSKVNWKFYAPYNQQQRAHLENPQRTQRAETALTQAQIPSASNQHHHQQRLVQSHHQPTQNLISTQPEYKSYASVPIHIKELILQTYQPQRPYVDPSSFIYQQSEPQIQQTNARADFSHSNQYEAPATKYQSIDDNRSASTNYDYNDGLTKSQGRVDYKQDYDQHTQNTQQLQHQQAQIQHQQQQQQQQHIIGITVPVETMPVQPVPKLVIDKNMPQEIQQLLQYQAQIPYDVIANRITYRPKTLFIPKPIPDDSKGSYYYKSKIYFMKDDNVDEIENTKPVEESQQH